MIRAGHTLSEFRVFGQRVPVQSAVRQLADIARKHDGNNWHMKSRDGDLVDFATGITEALVVSHLYEFESEGKKAEFVSAAKIAVRDVIVPDGTNLRVAFFDPPLPAEFVP